MTEFDVQKIWADLHAIPELSMEEKKTGDYIAARLQELGIPSRRVVNYGVLAEICGSEPGPVLLARADMDALPFIVDGKKIAYHGCGHDSHSAMLLTAVSRVADKIKKGKLKIFFQPAEETMIGALHAIDEGIIDDVDLAVGLHLRPIQDIPLGTMTPGIKHSSMCFIDFTVKGQGCHGSRPHLGINAIDVAAAIIQGINAIHLNPRTTWSCKVTGIKAGYVAANIIPDVCEMVADCRTEFNADMDELLKKIDNIVKGVAAAYGTTAEYRIRGAVAPAAELDPGLTEELAAIIRETVGEDKTMPVLFNTGSEDFHFFATKKPSLKAAYFGIGAGCAPGLHDVNMHFDASMLPAGVTVLEKFILSKLG